MEITMVEKQEGSRSEDGWYEHKETGAVVHLVNEPDYGTPLTNAYIKTGFVYVGTEDPRTKVEPKAETPVVFKK